MYWALYLEHLNQTSLSQDCRRCYPEQDTRRLRHPYECDADRVSEESDLIPILLQNSRPCSRPCENRAPEGSDRPVRPRIRVERNWSRRLDGLQPTFLIRWSQQRNLYTTSSSVRWISVARRAVVPPILWLSGPLFQDSSMTHSRLEKKLYRIVFFAQCHDLRLCSRLGCIWPCQRGFQNRKCRVLVERIRDGSVGSRRGGFCNLRDFSSHQIISSEPVGYSDFIKAFLLVP